MTETFLKNDQLRLFGKNKSGDFFANFKIGAGGDFFFSANKPPRFHSLIGRKSARMKKATKSVDVDLVVDVVVFVVVVVDVGVVVVIMVIVVVNVLVAVEAIVIAVVIINDVAVVLAS